MSKNIEELRKENELIDLFCTLVQIPSPSGEEEKVSAKIVEILTSAGIESKEDHFKNVTAKIPATDSDKSGGVQTLPRPARPHLGHDRGRRGQPRGNCGGYRTDAVAGNRL